MKKLLGIVVLGLLWCNMSLAVISETFESDVEEIYDECILQSQKTSERKPKNKKYCKCYIEHLDKTIEDNEFETARNSEDMSSKEVKSVIRKFKAAQKICTKEIFKTKYKKDKSKLTEEKILDMYKSLLPKCEGGEADMSKDLLRWTKWNNCLGTLKLTDESGEELTFISEFKNGSMLGKMSFKDNSGRVFGIMKKSGCKKNGHGILNDGSIAKIELDKGCNITKQTILE